MVGLIALAAGAMSPVGGAAAPAMPDAAIVPDATASHPRAGLWRLSSVINVTALDGTHVTASPQTRQSEISTFCYLKDDVKNFGETLQQSADSICDQLSVTATDGNLFIAESCKLKDGRIEMAGRGTHGGSGYGFDATGTGQIDSHVADFAVSFTGRYLRPCTAAEAKE